MVPALLRVVCFCMATHFWVLASEREPGTKTDEVVGTNPAPFSLWSTLKREAQSFDDRNSEKFSNGQILKQHDTNGKPACRSCGSDGSMTEREGEVKAARLNSITNMLLDKMRVPSDDLDKVSSDEKDYQGQATLPKLPPVLLNQRIDLDGDLEPNGDEYYAWDKQTIEPGKYFTEQCPVLRAGGCYSFDMSDLQTYLDIIQGSTLWLHIFSVPRLEHQHHELVLYEMLPYNASHPGSTWSRQKIIAHSYTDTTDNWLQVDLTEFIQRYLLSQSRTLSIAIACNTCYRNNDRQMFGAQDGFEPLLITNLLHLTSVREKRSESSCNPSTSCCRRPLEVDFARVGLHSVHQPSLLSIGYCFGSCEGMTDYSANHTLFKHYKRMDSTTSSRLRTELRPCCVPTMLTQVDVYRYVNGHGRLSTIPNAKVVRCGCR